MNPNQTTAAPDGKIGRDSDTGVDQLIALYRLMFAARTLDETEAELVTRGEAFFHVSGQGHEATAALAPLMIEQDWLLPHYRDKALMLGRGIPPEQFFHGLFGNETSSSAGCQMCAFLSDADRRIVSASGPVGNASLQAVGIAATLKDDADKPIVVNAIGDGTTQEGEVMEAIAEAVRSNLPVLFLVEDNKYAISTPTANKTFLSLNGKPADSYYGLPIHHLDGRDAAACAERLGPIVDHVRQQRGPAIAVLDVERLSNHTNADDQRVYRPAEQLERLRREADPVAILRARLIEAGLDESRIIAVEDEVRADIRDAAERALDVGDPEPCFDAKRPLPDQLKRASSEYRGDSSTPRLTMLEAMRDVLMKRMARDDRVSLYGQDIEDPKGDVFGVTRGLTKAYPGRVINAPLSESTILGASIGKALAGKRPVAFIQFADFFPLAFNQLFCELGNMYWRTAGSWQCPVIVMVACGGYRPGLGPFHAHTHESIAAHVPGVDVFMPSTAPDAAGLLNAAFESGRPTIFFYPKICLNDRDQTTSSDAARQLVPPGKARFITQGDKLTIVTWGSTVGIGRKVAEALEPLHIDVDLIDLRSLVPWDREAVCESARKSGKLLVVHEDNLTCGFGAEVVAHVTEQVAGPLAVRRVTRPDTYVPFNFTNQLEVLPGFKRTLEAAADLLDLDLQWKLPADAEADTTIVEAIGSSPADQAVTVVNWNVNVGQQVKAGEAVADLDADKAVFELTAPVSGTVDALLVPEGQSVRVGSPLMRMRTQPTEGKARRKKLTREEPGEPVLTRKRSRPASRALAGTAPSARGDARVDVAVGMSSVYTAIGSQRLTNDQLVQGFPDRTAEDIISRTGIESRPRLAPNETALSIAVDAARQALEGEQVAIEDISAIICATTTPLMITPSMACLVQHELTQHIGPHDAPAHDVLAACTGYLYALAAGYDHIQAQPDARVLIITTEGLSRQVNPADFDTAIIFGDAASATLLYGPEHFQRARGLLHRPVLSAKGESGETLRVPNVGCGFIEMDGKKVFAEAVRQMLMMLERACDEAGLGVNQIDLFVPHQANGRIIEAIRARLRVPEDHVVNAVRHFGNTSSSSIPLCMESLMEKQTPGTRMGLCAFGGGFTFGAAVLERIDGENYLEEH